MAAVIDFTTRCVIAPPPSQLRRDERLEEHLAWNRRRNFMLAAKFHLRAIEYRNHSMGRDDPDFANRGLLWERARAAYREARVALMAWPACDKKGVQWKWRQMSELADCFDRWAAVLGTDEARFGMRDGRPKSSCRRRRVISSA